MLRRLRPGRHHRIRSVQQRSSDPNPSATGAPIGFPLATRNDFGAAGNSFWANQASDPVAVDSDSAAWDNHDVCIDVIQVMF